MHADQVAAAIALLQARCQLAADGDEFRRGSGVHAPDQVRNFLVAPGDPACPGTRFLEGDYIGMPFMVDAHDESLPGLLAEADERVDVLEISFVGPQGVVPEPGYFSFQVGIGKTASGINLGEVHACEHDQDDIEALGLPVMQDMQGGTGIEEAKQLPLGIAEPEGGLVISIDEVATVRAGMEGTEGDRHKESANQR